MGRGTLFLVAPFALSCASGIKIYGMAQYAHALVRYEARTRDAVQQHQRKPSPA